MIAEQVGPPGKGQLHGKCRYFFTVSIGWKRDRLKCSYQGRMKNAKTESASLRENEDSTRFVLLWSANVAPVIVVLYFIRRTGLRPNRPIVAAAMLAGCVLVQLQFQFFLQERDLHVTLSLPPPRLLLILQPATRTRVCRPPKTETETETKKSIYTSTPTHTVKTCRPLLFLSTSTNCSIEVVSTTVHVPYPYKSHPSSLSSSLASYLMKEMVPLTTA